MNIFLTGATGLVGGELLVNLSKRNDVKKIYCLTRAGSKEDAITRLAKVFALRADEFDESKIIPVIGNLFDESLTDSLINNSLLKEVNVVIHSAANTSFSKINDALVEKANIGGLTKILLWAKQLPDLETFLYVGTATICGRDITNRVVHEDESPNTSVNHLVRYTYTKMQGELLLREHLPENKILITRPSIIMGDSRPVMPRSPVILWAMATINHLRLIPVNQHAKLDMIPVDYTVKAIIGLLFAKRKYTVYHISAGEQASTSAQKLSEALTEYFDDMIPFRFIDRSYLNQLKLWSKNKLQPGSEVHDNHQEYLDYWKHTFEEAGNLRILFAGLDPYLNFMELGQVFDNSRLLEDFPEIGAPEPADVYMARSMHFVEKIDIMEGAIDP